MISHYRIYQTKNSQRVFIGNNSNAIVNLCDKQKIRVTYNRKQARFILKLQGALLSFYSFYFQIVQY